MPVFSSGTIDLGLLDDRSASYEQPDKYGTVTFHIYTCMYIYTYIPHLLSLMPFIYENLFYI